MLRKRARHRHAVRTRRLHSKAWLLCCSLHALHMKCGSTHISTVTCASTSSKAPTDLRAEAPVREAEAAVHGVCGQLEGLLADVQLLLARGILLGLEQLCENSKCVSTAAGFERSSKGVITATKV